jgi:hypothetical protein
MFDHETLEAVRERLPAPADDRDAEVDEALDEGERVGFKEGEPLADVPYSEYPDPLEPSAGDVLRAVVEHERVTEPSDVADELHTSVSRVRRGADLHGVELPSGGSFDVEVATRTFDVPLHDGPVHLEDLTDDPADDHRLMHHLVVTAGLGVSEVVTFLERAVNDARAPSEPRYSVTEQDVKDTLREMNLLEGPTTAERERDARRRGRGADELNRTTTTVDLTENDPDDYGGGGNIIVNDAA